MIALRLPWPPSVNNYYRKTKQGVFLSRRGRLYRAEVRIAAVCQRITKPLTGYLIMRVRLHPPNRRNYDMDNLLKALWDALECAGVFENDAQIKRLEMEDTFEMDNFVEVEIESFVSHET